MTLTKTINSSKLANIIELPESLKNKNIEILIRPVFEDDKTENVNDIVSSLIGVIPDTGRTLKSYQEERRDSIESLGAY